MTNIYSRTPEGLITFHGDQNISERAKLDEVYGGFPRSLVPHPEREAAQGWPDPIIKWHGAIGFGCKS